MESNLPHADTAEQRRQVFGVISSALLLAVVAWTVYFLVSAPGDVSIRLHLSNDPTPGSKWRLVTMPVLMALVYVLAGQAERMGTVNTSGREPVSPEEARAAAAGLRLFSMGLFTLLVMSMVAGGLWSWGEAALPMAVCLSFALMAVLTYRFFARVWS